MTIFKKLTAAIAAAVMSLTMASTSFAAVAGDVVDSPYEESIETLGALGIMVGDDDGQFRPDAVIRRSEFAKVAVETLGLGEVAEASGYQTKYPDVVENHWANGYINVATQQGIIIGDDEGNFRPDDAISYAEAMTILVRLIGHEPSALSKGGFPTGYMVVGSQNGISKNAVASADTDVVRGMVAQMTFNALTVKMMEQTGFGDNVKYEVVDKTILEDVLDVTKDKGQITALGISSISGNSSLKDNEVRIGDNIFTVSDQALPTVRNLVGFNVVYYVRADENGHSELILARAEKNRNHAVTVPTGNMEDVQVQDGENTFVEYWEDKDNDKKTKTLEIASDARMIFNGQALQFDASLLRPESGRLTFLDIDNDDIHDLVFVTSFTNLVVENVISSSHKVTDKYGNPSLVLDPDDQDVKFTMTKSGQLIKLSDLKEWDVLSIAKSRDASIISVEVSGEKVSGRVDEIDGEKRIINGKEYEVAKNYREEIKLGDEGTFYLDVEGKIAAADTAAGLSSNYAYIVDADLTTGFNTGLELKLFNKEGETEIVKVADKVRLNGVSGKTPEEILTALKDGGDEVKPQLSTYEKNAKGEISRLTLAADGNGSVDKTKFTLNAQGEMIYKKSSHKLGIYNISEDTLIFNIPAGETDTKEYSVEKREFFDDNEPYDVLIFDAGEDLTAKAVIVTNSAASASIEAPLAIVDQITNITNEDNESAQKLYVYLNGERVSYLTAEDGLLVNGDGEKLKKGDVVQLKLDAKNEITALRVVFEVADKDVEFTKTEDDLSLVYGRVTKKFASSMNVQVNDGAVENFSLNQVRVYELDTTKTSNAIRVSDAGSITQYDESDPARVLVKIYQDAVQEVIIVK